MNEPQGVASRDRGMGVSQHSAATPRHPVRSMYWLVKRLVLLNVAERCSATLPHSCNGAAEPDSVHVEFRVFAASAGTHTLSVRFANGSPDTAGSPASATHRLSVNETDVGTVHYPYASWGSWRCLVGSIYCAPLTPTGEGLRMHNLAAYVLDREAPAFLRRVGRPGATPTPLVFEIDVPHQAYRGLAGIDYLRLGAIHLRIYSLLEYLLSQTERHRLHETITSRTKNSAGFLALASAIAQANTTVDPERFLRLLHETIPRLPILGYVYFEALAEYLMLHSTSPETRRLAELGSSTSSSTRT